MVRVEKVVVLPQTPTSGISIGRNDVNAAASSNTKKTAWRSLNNNNNNYMYVFAIL